MGERPISVGELLRREGHQSESHDSQARRALGGVAVGAVLAFGAVVGGLVLHNAGATPSDMPAAGGGTAGGVGFNGSVPVASTGTIGSNSPKIQPAANTTTVNPGITTQRGGAPNNSGRALGGGAVGTTVDPTPDSSFPGTSGTLPTSTGSTSTGTSTSTGSTSTGTSTGTSKPGSTSSSSGTTTGSTPTSTGSNSGSGGGGLLGAVGSTLGSVTQPVFNWFGGN
jgi:hypothetical protein